MPIPSCITAPDGKTYVRSQGSIWYPSVSIEDFVAGKVPCEVCGQPAVRVTSRLIDITQKGDEFRNYELTTDRQYFCIEHCRGSSNRPGLTTVYAGDYGPDDYSETMRKP